MKAKPVGLKKLCKRLAVEIVKVENTDLTAESVNIVYNVTGLGLTDSEFVFSRVKIFHHFNKSLYSERIMLT